jgi:GNAT superfamily N-acetyltransferase
MRETATGIGARTVGDAFRVRAMTPEDRDGLRGMFSRLSEDTIYKRFLMPYPSVPEWMVSHLADHRGGESLVAVAGGQVVGHAMYAPELGGEAEVAIVVEDGWQSRGVGKALLAGLARSARRHGIRTFTADVLGENRRMMGLLNSLFGEVESRAASGAYHVRIPLHPLTAQSPTNPANEAPGPSDPWSKVGKRHVVEIREPGLRAG